MPYIPGEWHLSAIAGPEARAALARVNAFNARWAGRARIASVEFAAAPPADITGLMRLAGDTTEAFFETPIDADLRARLDAISAAGGAAKVRAGGTTPAAIRAQPRWQIFYSSAHNADSPSRPRPACITPCEAATLLHMSATAQRR